MSAVPVFANVPGDEPFAAVEPQFAQALLAIGGNRRRYSKRCSVDHVAPDKTRRVTDIDTDLSEQLASHGKPVWWDKQHKFFAFQRPVAADLGPQQVGKEIRGDLVGGELKMNRASHHTWED